MIFGIGHERSDRPKGESGFILVAVLWILAALAALAASYSIYVGDAASAIQVNDDRLQIRNAISSGIELTALKLLIGADSDRQPKGAFTVRLARSTIDVSFISESARIDLNAAPKGLLEGMFAAVGVNSAEAATFADRVMGWRKKTVPSGQNSEAEVYKEAGLDYAPRQAPFQNVFELRLVAGLPAYIVDRVLPLVTVYSGRPEIDVRVAPAEVLSSLPNITSDELQKVLERRAEDPSDGEGLLTLLGPARVLANTAPNPAVRIAIRIRLDDERSASAEIVILTSHDDDEPYRVLSWRDDSEGS